jgi:UDP-2,3-diacylglucosamine hydrolase
MCVYMSKISSYMVVVSDIHLIDSQDRSWNSLLHLLNNIDSQQCRYFILAGDIFDFFLPGVRYFEEKFQGIIQAIQKIAAEGVKVYYIQGNHEFGFTHFRWIGVEVVTVRDLRLPLPDGRTIAFCHGDRLVAPWHYFVYLAVIRSWIVTMIAHLLPSSWLDRLALNISSRSRARDPYRTLNHARVLAAANHWLASTGAELGVIGHFHYPYNHRVSAGNVVGLPSWARPNALCIDTNGITRVLIGNGEHRVVELGEAKGV